MKKNGIKLLIIFLIILICIITFITVKKNRVTKDEKSFKKEYERYNGYTNPGSDKKYFDVNIEEKNGIKYLDDDEVIDMLQNKTGIIYFGFPTCPWCRSMIEVLLDAKDSTNQKNIYYYNALDIRDEKVLEDGKVKTTKKGKKNYYKILDILGDKASVYEELEDESIKRLYFPTVVFVRNGKIVDIHISTVDSQEDPYKKLNKKQKAELKKIYTRGIAKMNGKECDSDTAC